MKTIHLRGGSTFFSGLLLALLAATALDALLATNPDNAERLTVERDQGKEDQVAMLFEGIRVEAKLPELKRIRHRDDLEQAVCTSALSGKRSHLGSAFYTATDPESINPELRQIAESNPLDSKKRPAYARYSVAVWRVKDRQTGELSYRVGIGLYGSGVGEFIDCHFTDDGHYCGKWKDSIARPCVSENRSRLAKVRWR
jgi:hypothetical protein